MTNSGVDTILADEPSLAIASRTDDFSKPPQPRRIFDLVREDLISAGLETREHNIRRRDFLFLGHENQNVEIEEWEDEGCAITLSDPVLEGMIEAFGYDNGSLILVKNRRQWRLVKPVIRHSLGCYSGARRRWDYEKGIAKLDGMPFPEMEEIFVRMYG